VLDVVMPVMDGFEFLQEKARHPEYGNIPVLVTTASDDAESEDRCLELGAWDFIPKPYKPRTVRLRLQNILARSHEELLQQLEYLSRHDILTGLPNRRAFFSALRALAENNPGQGFSLVRMDVNHFGLINSLYGETEGDRLLCHIAALVRSAAEGCTPSAFGRMEGDVFCLCVPRTGPELKRFLAGLQKELAAYPARYYLEPSFGVCSVEMPLQEPEILYRRACLASQSCKNSYQSHVAYFTPDMEKAGHRAQRIANEMESALATGQFVMYLQPKFDIVGGCICGAEALVRWRHPQRGVLSPDLYVPVFERNGFITQLDGFMWEQVCRFVRAQLDAGAAPLPISVNVSRQNLYNPHLVRQLLSLVRKYQVPPALIQLELTESAYVDSPVRLRQTVERLHRSGFTLLMDDFGSGYSSLNALKDLPVDILKLDMNFLASTKNEQRGRSILVAMLRMSEALQLPMIVEGVETRAQLDFLKAHGGRYAQGYYFSQPLPAEQYLSVAAENGARL
jgi:diguanylate cyclase (GGDEF)-like protein